MREMMMWDKYDNKYRNVVDVEVAKGLESDLYEANNRINDLLDILKQKDKIIDLMADEILEQDISNQDDIEHYDNKHEVMKYFEERCK